MEDFGTNEPPVYRTVSHEDVPEDWLLMKSPYPVMTCLVLYLLVVTLGPRLMRSRDPYQLTTALRIYNVLQVLMNGHMLLLAYVHRDYMKIFLSNVCMLPNVPSVEPGVQVMVLACWRYLLTKLMDLIDTVFMVFRKKNSQITFLHVYHHFGMVFFSWYTFKYYSFYHAIPPAVVNTSIHLVMYSYYFLATFPKLKGYLWWKQYITKLQLAQFVFILLYMAMIYNMGCSISPEFTYIWMINESIFLVLFINFYVKAYIFNTPKIH